MTSTTATLAVQTVDVDDVPLDYVACISKGQFGGWLVEWSEDGPDAASSLAKALHAVTGLASTVYRARGTDLYYAV